MGKRNNHHIFEQVLLLIETARNKTFQRVNEELILLYFKVGGIVSDKVSTGIWGDHTVEELAAYIHTKYPGLHGFNRRGLYRMKQFYETYTVPEFVSPLVTQIETLKMNHLDLCQQCLHKSVGHIIY